MTHRDDIALLALAVFATAATVIAWLQGRQPPTLRERLVARCHGLLR